MSDDRFEVVNVNDNRGAAPTDFSSESAAREWMQRAAADDPTLAGQLHVVPTSERYAA